MTNNTRDRYLFVNPVRCEKSLVTPGLWAVVDLGVGKHVRLTREFLNTVFDTEFWNIQETECVKLSKIKYNVYK